VERISHQLIEERQKAFASVEEQQRAAVSTERVLQQQVHEMTTQIALAKVHIMHCPSLLGCH
jgi:hypothetical protein